MWGITIVGGGFRSSLMTDIVSPRLITMVEDNKYDNI